MFPFFVDRYWLRSTEKDFMSPIFNEIFILNIERLFCTFSCNCIMGIKSVKEFDLLYKSYYSALCYFAIKIVADRDSAEDIVDEVFAGLLTSKREFSESDNLKAWLYTATRNASLNHLKREQHIKEHQLQFSLKHEREESPYLFEMIRTEVFRNILLEIKKLPGHSGKIIEMSYFEGMKNDQIAELLGLSIDRKSVV